MSTAVATPASYEHPAVVRNQDPGYTAYPDAVPSGGAEIGPEHLIRYAFTAGTPGSAGDKTIYAVGKLPAKCRPIRWEAIVTTAIDSKTLKLYTAASGGGSQVLDTLTTSGAAAQHLTGALAAATAAITPAADVGLFLRLSDIGLAGEVHIWVQPER